MSENGRPVQWLLSGDAPDLLEVYANVRELVSLLEAHRDYRGAEILTDALALFERDARATIAAAWPESAGHRLLEL